MLSLWIDLQNIVSRGGLPWVLSKNHIANGDDVWLDPFHLLYIPLLKWKIHDREATFVKVLAFMPLKLRILS